MNIKTTIDSYTFTAKITPALLVLLPYLYVMHSTEMSGIDIINSFFISGVILLIMVAIMPTMGNGTQKKLYASYGANPASIMLRHSDTTLPLALKKHYHQLLSEFFGQKFPSESFEAANPKETGVFYDMCVSWLEENTANHNKFHLLWREKTSYLFWRNLLACKGYGIFVAVLATLITVGAFFLAKFGLYRFDVRMLLTPVVSVIALWGWIKHVNATAVKEAAYAYAKALLSECENMHKMKD